MGVVWLPAVAREFDSEDDFADWLLGAVDGVVGLDDCPLGFPLVPLVPLVPSACPVVLGVEGVSVGVIFGFFSISIYSHTKSVLGSFLMFALSLYPFLLQ